MMRPSQRLTRQLIQSTSQPLSHSPSIYKNQRRSPLPNNLQQSRIDRLPDRSPLRPLRSRPTRLLFHLPKPSHILHRNLHPQHQRLPRSRIHHRHWPISNPLSPITSPVIHHCSQDLISIPYSLFPAT